MPFRYSDDAHRAANTENHHPEGTTYVMNTMNVMNYKRDIVNFFL
jgi:hypothetical protein